MTALTRFFSSNRPRPPGSRHQTFARNWVFTATASDPDGTVAAIAPDGALVALLQDAGPQARPVVVFAPA